MQVASLTPSPRYRTKMRWLEALALTAAFLGGWLVMAVAITSEPDVDAWVGWAILATFVPVLAVTVVLVELWVSSISYDVREDDILVHKGILVQTLKVIPYRNVTNIARKRDILDRWFFRLGSLEVETAGSSQRGGADAVLVGLDDWEGLYGVIMDTLARFRGRAMSPTAAGQVEAAPSAASDVQGQILEELRAIRRALEQR